MPPSSGFRLIEGDAEPSSEELAALVDVAYEVMLHTRRTDVNVFLFKIIYPIILLIGVSV